MRYFITGGAGFIGSCLAEALSKEAEITVYDNLSLGKEENLSGLKRKKGFRFIKADLLDFKSLSENIAGHDAVFHMAANSDIEKGAKVTDIDLKNGTVATYNVLEAMRLNNIKKIIFASSSAVYGEANKSPINEDAGPLFPISLYGASKLASEGLISAFCHNYRLKAWIFRFANIVGRHGTHGVVYDFIKKLRKNNKDLSILGDGNQAKPYLEVDDCVSGMIYGFRKSFEEVNYFNLGCKGNTKVSDIAKIVIKEMGLNEVGLSYAGGKRGWPGDVPVVELDISKMKLLGWEARYTSDEAVKLAAVSLIKEIAK